MVGSMDKQGPVPCCQLLIHAVFNAEFFRACMSFRFYPHHSSCMVKMATAATDINCFYPNFDRCYEYIQQFTVAYLLVGMSEQYGG
jgi:hypothetical protein